MLFFLNIMLIVVAVAVILFIHVLLSLQKRAIYGLIVPILSLLPLLFQIIYSAIEIFPISGIRAITTELYIWISQPRGIINIAVFAALLIMMFVLRKNRDKIIDKMKKK